MEKIFNQKNFHNFVWSPLGSRGNIYLNFCLQVHFQVSAAWYCSHYLPPVSTTPLANLPPVPLIRRCQLRRWQIATGFNNTRGTGGKICSRCRWHRWQICRRCCWYRRQFATGVNLPPVLLTTVAHLDLRISPRIFEKIRNDPDVIIRGLGEGDSWQKPEAKNLVTLSL